jgi:hypothetical protein
MKLFSRRALSKIFRKIQFQLIFTIKKFIDAGRSVNSNFDGENIKNCQFLMLATSFLTDFSFLG